MKMRGPNSIRRIRRARDPELSQEALGKLVGVSQSRISAWEAGKEVPQLENALDLANALTRPVEVVFEQLHRDSADRVARRRDHEEQDGA